MNTLVAKIVSLLKRDRYAENPIDLAEKPISPAAFAVMKNPSNFTKAKDA